MGEAIIIRQVFVLGSGVMGSGITQVVARAGYAVTMMDTVQDVVNKGLDAIDKSLSRSAQKGVISSQDKTAALSHISVTTDMTEAREADLIIEAIPEMLDLKLDVLRKLDNICAEHAILASNTSALPISALAAVTSAERQRRVIGMHFMNPATVMKGVEVIPGRHTSEETLRIGKEFVMTLGKEVCEAVDYAGFIVSRIIDAMINEAVRCLMDGNKPEQIDRAMRLCCNLPMGPLELCDLAGADVVLHGLNTMQREFGDRFLAAPLLLSMVRAGDLGRKAGRGFYDYTKKT